METRAGVGLRKPELVRREKGYSSSPLGPDGTCVVSHFSQSKEAVVVWKKTMRPFMRRLG